MPVRPSLFAALLMAGVGATACDAKPSAPPTAPTTAAQPQTAPLVAAGPPAVLVPEAADEASMQYAASVDQVQWVSNNSAKLFGLAGGDPAMNGLYSYIAFYASPDTGWTVFKLGDFLDYTVLSSAPGRVELDIHESVYEQVTASVGDRHRRVIVTWTPDSDDVPPTSVTVTPAR